MLNNSIIPTKLSVINTFELELLKCFSKSKENQELILQEINNDKEKG
ncbi:10322_t:CDS:2, partial [Gigaspora margarita]